MMKNYVSPELEVCYLRFDQMMANEVKDSYPEYYTSEIDDDDRY